MIELAADSGATESVIPTEGLTSVPTVEGPASKVECCMKLQMGNRFQMKEKNDFAQ